MTRPAFGGDVLFFDADIHTFDPSRPRARALAVRGGHVVAAGEPKDLRARLAPDARGIALGGRVVTPGFTDAHTHIELCARARSRLSLAGATTIAAVSERVRARHAALPAGEWLVGEDLAPYSTWSPAPLRALLDAAAPGRPVVLWTRDRHAGWASSAALEAAGVAARAADPPGGALGRDAAGGLTGWLFEGARLLVAPPAGSAAGGEDFASVLREWAGYGITCVHDFGGPDTWRALRALRERGGLGVRVAFGFLHDGQAGGEDAAKAGAAVHAARAEADERLWPFALKVFADGSLGARTAHLLAPYEGGADTGLPTLEPAALDALGEEARGLGLTLAVHAIGDAAVRRSLDAFARWPEGARRALRPRIEHAQLVSPVDRPRFGALGVVASMQPVHAVSDRTLAARLWGARAEAGGYAWRQLEAAGAVLAFGSDAPVESPDPRRGIAAALTGGDPEAWARGEAPGRALSLARAWAGFTHGAAWAVGREDQLGRLAPGAWADFVAWESDPFSADASTWPGLAIASTWVGGERAYPAPAV